MLDDTYKLDKCVKIALLYLEVNLNMLNIQITIDLKSNTGLCISYTL